MDRPHSATWPRRDDALRGTLARMRTLCTTRREASVPPGHRRYCHRLGGPLLLALLLSALQGSGASAQEVTLPIVADTSIASFEGERTLNYGHAARLKLKGLENIILLTPDCALLVGKRVEHAVLHLRGCDAHLMVRKVGLSTVATRWNEGTSEGSGPGGPGDSCFQSPELGSTRLWAGAGSCFLDAVGGRGSTLWSQSIATHDQDQWYSIEVDGRLLEACACGLSYGLAVSDDNGQTMSVAKQVDPQTNFSNNYFFAREQRASAPTITATLAEAAAIAPAPLAVQVTAWRPGADQASGGLEISWPGPPEPAAAAIIGYRIRTAQAGQPLSELPRWMHPPIGLAGERVRALLRFQPPEAHYEAQVEVIGRGGVVIATGRASGASSAAFAGVQALQPAPLPAAHAGAPPATPDGTVWAVPDLVKVNPITGNVAEEAGVGYTYERQGQFSQANGVWNGESRTIALQGLRQEWVGFQIVCQGRAGPSEWSITPHALVGPQGHQLPASAIQLARTWYQQVGSAPRAWYADPLLPLASGERFRIPDERNAVPGQTNQTVYAELFIPAATEPGSYAGELLIGSGAAEPVRLAIALTVRPAAIPERTSFQFSLNAYSSPGEYFGPAESPAFLAGERRFYVMAHEHRTTLALLGYGHSAHFQAGIAWPLRGSGPDMQVADWSAWDQRFGPLFDGSAFAGTSRAGVPYDHFYLPFMESWPTPMASGYRWNALTWEEHWKQAGPVTEGFSPLYRQQWIAVMRDLERHIAAKKWQTTFQVYLNDKYFYKQYDPKRQRDGEGTSFWLLDEPQHIDDFSALAFFGGLIRQGQEGDHSRVVFRADISRPQWGRDTLDRLVDLNVSGGFADYRPWLEEWRVRYGQRVWTYGGAPPSTASALGIEQQALDLYARGVDGFVPWLTLGGPGNWTHFEDTCVLYDGTPMGIMGPCASLRLKAYRRGEQDVEYVQLLAEQLGLLAQDPNRRQVALLLAGALGGHARRGTLDAQGAVTEAFTDIPVDAAECLRREIARRLH